MIRDLIYDKPPCFAWPFNSSALRYFSGGRQSNKKSGINSLRFGLFSATDAEGLVICCWVNASVFRSDFWLTISGEM